MNRYGELMPDVTLLHLAVYGTLIVGEGNWEWALKLIPCVKMRDTIKGYTMHTFGGFPCVIYTGVDTDVIEVDVFDLSDDPADLDDIHYMEVGAGYHVEEATTEGGYDVFLYAYKDSGFMHMTIPSGSWRTYLNEDVHGVSHG